MHYSIVNYRHHTVLHPPDLIILWLEVCTFWPPSIILPTLHLWQPPICSLYPWAWFFAGGGGFCFVLFCLFVFLDSMYKWDDIVFVFLCLTFSLSITPSRIIHAVAKGKISFSFGLIVFLVHTYHIFFIHSSLRGIHILAIENMLQWTLGAYIFSVIFLLNLFY